MNIMIYERLPATPAAVFSFDCSYTGDPDDCCWTYSRSLDFFQVMNVVALKLPEFW